MQGYIKNQIFILFCVVQLLFCMAWAQETVTFTGAVTRHETVELDVAVQGAVYIHYGFGDFETEFSVEVPFTIPAGQRSTSYEETVNWSLAGSVDNDNGTHDFLRISVRCLQNCEQANVRETIAFSKENGITGSTKDYDSPRDIELYGTSDGAGGYDRAGGYIVNLSLLPEYATISGTLVLPDGQSAPEGLNIQLFGLDYATVGGSASTQWVIPTQQLVTFQAGSSEMRFRFAIDLTRLADNRAGTFIFGYNCISEACNDLGLVESALFDSDANRLLSNNNLFDVALDNFLITDNDDDPFNLQLPQPITMLGSNKQAINIIQNQKETSFENQVVGRIIVEKYKHNISCDFSYTPLVDFSSDEPCFFPYGTQSPSIITVSETPFTINAGDSEISLSIDVHEMNQIISANRYDNKDSNEHQRIKVVCDTGCDSPKLKNSGYYREQSKYLMARGSGGAHQFQLTEDFSAESLIISLENLLFLPYLDLLMDEESRVD